MHADIMSTKNRKEKQSSEKKQTIIKRKLEAKKMNRRKTEQTVE